MDNYSQDELKKALILIGSLASKCEKAKINLTAGHRTLIENRIAALQIASTLIKRQIIVE